MAFSQDSSTGSSEMLQMDWQCLGAAVRSRTLDAVALHFGMLAEQDSDRDFAEVVEAVAIRRDS